jgi:DNA polymerase III epsilon subunit-like protein
MGAVVVIVFDTETTGLIKNVAVPLKDQPQIIELYAQKLDDQSLETIGEWHSLFFVKEVSEEVTNITSITTEMLKDAPKFAQKLESLVKFFLGELILVGHNLAYDRDMLAVELKRLDASLKFPWPHRHICTVEASEAIDGFRLSLTALHEKLFGQGFQDAHRAKSDVSATVNCLRELVNRRIIEL